MLWRLLAVGVRILVCALLIWQGVEAFTAFQAGNPGADFWTFVIDRGPIYFSILLVGVAVLALAAWFERSLPPSDADRTEFHEKGNQ